jgi:formylglycine-generating enzyme required for sulfatase activity
MTATSSPTEPARQAREGMIWIPGGTFLMGSDRNYPEEAPAHRVSVDGFWIDRTCVTNREFARFVEATGHVTLAERPADPADYPDAAPELLVPASAVVQMPDRPVNMLLPYSWWAYVPGADWRHPRGPGSSIDDLPDHPVVHVAFEDVAAYAAWAGKDLPTEAEWEFAARGGLDGAEFAWGDELVPGGVHMANTWQGEFPRVNTMEDGYLWTSPVGAFPANGYGLFDMIGNVWEWTADWYQDHARIERPCCVARNPRGGPEETSGGSAGPNRQTPRKVLKGGSHLCAPNYCQRYRPAARLAHPVDTTTCHVGFRCVLRA